MPVCWLAVRQSVWRPLTMPTRAHRAPAPDCVVYAASGPGRDAAAVPFPTTSDCFEAGINVVSTSVHQPGAFRPSYYVAAGGAISRVRRRRRGNVSFYVVGESSPGFRLAINWRCSLRLGPRRLSAIKVTEVALNDHYPVADVMMNGMGFGPSSRLRTDAQDPRLHRNGLEGTDLPDGEPASESRCPRSADRSTGARHDRDIEVAFGTIPAGTCGAVCARAAGVVNGRDAIVIEHIIRMARDVAPEWLTSEFDATYRVDIEGDPDIHCAMNLGRGRGPRRGSWLRWPQPRCGSSTHSATLSMPLRVCSARSTCRAPRCRPAMRLIQLGGRNVLDPIRYARAGVRRRDDGPLRAAIEVCSWAATNTVAWRRCSANTTDPRTVIFRRAARGSLSHSTI